MKKLLAIMLAAVMAVAMVGCKGEPENPGSNPSEPSDSVDVTKELIEKITVSDDISKMVFDYYDGEVKTYTATDKEDIDKIKTALGKLDIEKTEDIGQIPLEKGYFELLIIVDGEDTRFVGMEGTPTKIKGSYTGRSGDTYIINNYDAFKSVMDEVFLKKDSE